MAMCRYVVTVLVAGLLLGATPAPKDDDAKKDREALQGTWKVVSVEDSGQAEPPDGVLLVFEKDTFAVKKGDHLLFKGTFKLDPSKKPKAIDMTVTQSEERETAGKELHGIYELTKDGLKWCSSEPGGTERPKEFSTKEGSKSLLVTLKKEKP
jgi:uncharacterized protein (TIGR03067 family)